MYIWFFKCGYKATKKYSASSLGISSIPNLSNLTPYKLLAP